MEFLEFVARIILGPPTREGRDPHWDCPNCLGDTKWHVMPKHPVYKTRWKCHMCGQRGDEFDLLRLVKPYWNYPQQKGQLAIWRREYKNRGFRTYSLPRGYKYATEAERRRMFEKLAADARIDRELWLEETALSKDHYWLR